MEKIYSERKRGDKGFYDNPDDCVAVDLYYVKFPDGFSTYIISCFVLYSDEKVYQDSWRKQITLEGVTDQARAIRKAMAVFDKLVDSHPNLSA